MSFQRSQSQALIDSRGKLPFCHKARDNTGAKSDSLRRFGEETPLKRANAQNSARCDYPPQRAKFLLPVTFDINDENSRRASVVDAGADDFLTRP